MEKVFSVKKLDFDQQTACRAGRNTQQPTIHFFNFQANQQGRREAAEREGDGGWNRR